MDCRTFNEHYVELLDLHPHGTLADELRSHLETCPECAARFSALQPALALLRPPDTIQPSVKLKEKIMEGIMTQTATPRLATLRLAPLWKPLAAAAALLILLAGTSMLVHTRRPSGGQPAGPQGPLSLVTLATAAEARNFAGPGLAHLVNEIVVDPVADAELAGLRWLPLVLLEPDGRQSINRLGLPAAPGQGYTIADEIWLDPAQGCFKRVLTKTGQLVYATAFDGRQLMTLDPAKPGAFSRQATASGFKPPKDMTEILGIYAGLPVAASGLREQSLAEDGEEKLPDGSAVRRFKSVMPPPPGAPAESWWIFKIRTADQTIAALEYFVQGQRMLSIRRVKVEMIPAGRKVAWNLDGLSQGKTAAGPQPGVDKDMVNPGITLETMIKKAGFQTYILSSDPAWTRPCTITDALDPASFGQRMFIIAWPAREGTRHIVLVQSPTYNRLLGPRVKTGMLVYESKNGFKVWSGGEERNLWLSDILLRSSGLLGRAKPAEGRTGYMLESPAGTFPALGVNGPLTDDELHALVDSLVPVRH